MALLVPHGIDRLVDTLAQSSAASATVSCAASQAGTFLTNMSTMDSLPGLDFGETRSFDDASLVWEQGVGLCPDTFPVQPWAPKRFEPVRRLQQAPQNKGDVDLMRDIERGGCFVAVKRMPIAWTRSGPMEFKQQHPNAVEQPWLDVCVVGYLHSMNYAYLCEPLGVFQDLENTYVVNSYATNGDMHTWCEGGSKPGFAREAEVRPVVVQIFEAIRCLHNLGIVHGDISLENIVLTKEESHEGGTLRVKIIDFGAVSLSRMCSGTCGKPSYVAPEIHGCPAYDGFLSDTFSLGVVLFGVVACCYPWLSTRPGKCKMFDYVSRYGLRPYLMARKGGHDGRALIESMSEPLVFLLEGLLAMNPAERLALCKHASLDETSASVWNSEWWKDNASDGCD